MLDKLGKAELGEATKAMGLVFAIGLVLAVIGGTLNVMISNDTTDYSDVEIPKEGDDTAVDATKMIGYFHQTGKGVVGLLAFWFPIVGMILIAVGIGTLSTRLSVLCMLAAPLGIFVLLLMLQDTVTIYGVIALYVLAVCADVKSTLSSGMFPERERNLVIACLCRKVGMAKVLAAYCTAYVAVTVSGYLLLEEVYVVLAVMASVHVVASAANIVPSRARKKKTAVVATTTTTATTTATHRQPNCVIV